MLHAVVIAQATDRYGVTAEISFILLEKELIDLYWLEPFSYQEYIPPCPEDCEIPGPMLNLQIPTPINCSPNPFGEWVTRTAYIKHADKNDGVVNRHSVLWSSNDEFDDLNNLYFDDVPIDGGYNHFELCHYERPYTLPGVFDKGDLNPPMEDLEEWIKSNYQRTN